MTYTISTFPGQSGCPIISHNCLIGVHIGGGKSHEFFNIGRLITFNCLENLYNWSKELNGDLFTINTKNLCQHAPQIISIEIEKIKEIEEKKKKKIMENSKEIKKHGIKV